MSLFLKRSGAAGGYPPRIACFVCAQEGPADYPLYVEPSTMVVAGAPAPPHFPFLLVLTPPIGESPVEASRGEAKACRPCYTTLMRQWEEYDRARVPLVKRSYWIKRVDGVPFPTNEQQQQAALQVQARLQQQHHHHVASAAVPVSAPPPVSSAVLQHHSHHAHIPVQPAATVASHPPLQVSFSITVLIFLRAEWLQKLTWCLQGVFNNMIFFNSSYLPLRCLQAS